MRRAPLFFFFLFVTVFSITADAFEIKKSALFVFLHEVKPVEDEAAKALEEENYAVALRRYRDALNGYERIWKEYPNLPQEHPYGLDRLVDESITKCKKTIEQIRDLGEEQDEFYQKLNQLIRVDFENSDVRSITKLLSSLTDVNIIIDETVFGNSVSALKPQISVRTDEAVPLRKIIISICDRSGLSYSVEKDHIFISTRVKLDSQK